MPVKYCTCGEKVVYSALTPPIQCPSCKVSFQRSKPSPSVTVEASTVINKTYTQEEVNKILSDQRYRGISIDDTQKQYPSNAIASNDENIADDEANDSEVKFYEVQANARLLAAGLDSSDFEVTTTPNVPKKFTELAKPVSIPQPVQVAKKARRSHK